MFAEVLDWCNAQSSHDSAEFATTTQRLDKSHRKEELGEQDFKRHTGVPVHMTVTSQPKNIQAPFATRIGDNLVAAIEEGKIPGITADMIPAIRSALMSPSDQENPNPIDFGLTQAGGHTGMNAAFSNIDISEIIAADGMGNVLKDAVIRNILADSDRVSVEEEMARGRFAKTEGLPAKEMHKLLDFNPIEKPEGPALPGEGVETGDPGKVSGIKRLIRKIKDL